MKFPNQLIVHPSATRQGHVVLRDIIKGFAIRSCSRRAAEQFAKSNRIQLIPMKESEAFNAA